MVGCLVFCMGPEFRGPHPLPSPPGVERSWSEPLAGSLQMVVVTAPAGPGFLWTHSARLVPIVASGVPFVAPGVPFGQVPGEGGLLSLQVPQLASLPTPVQTPHRQASRVCGGDPLEKGRRWLCAEACAAHADYRAGLRLLFCDLGCFHTCQSR